MQICNSYDGERKTQNKTGREAKSDLYLIWMTRGATTDRGRLFIVLAYAKFNVAL